MNPLKLCLYLPLVLLSACSILPASKPLQVFRLPDSGQTAVSQRQALDLTLRLHTPEAGGLIAEPRIVVIPKDYQVSAYEGVRWSQPGPLLLRDQLLDNFRQSHRFKAISTDENPLTADVDLFGDLLAFQCEYTPSGPQVVLRYDALLRDTKDGHIVATRRFSVRQPSANTAVESVVKAFGQASDRLSVALLDWTSQQLTKPKSSNQR